MNSNSSVVVIYGLIIIFAILSIVFLTGKGKTLFVGHNTTKAPPVQYDETKQSCRNMFFDYYSDFIYYSIDMERMS